MYLYELAMELDQRSADIAERAESLGLGPMRPASELTADQVHALRAAYHRTAPSTSNAFGAPPANPSWGAPDAAPSGAPTPSGGSRLGSFIAIGVAAVAALGMFGFIAVNAGPDDERQRKIDSDLAKWQDEPAATVSPDVVAEAQEAIPGYQALDEDKLCAAQDVMYNEEIYGLAELVEAGRYDEARAIGANRTKWRTAMDEMIRWGPADARDEITAYRDTLAHYYDVQSRASDEELRTMWAGPPGSPFENRRSDVARVEDGMYPQIIPICGNASE